MKIHFSNAREIQSDFRIIYKLQYFCYSLAKKIDQPLQLSNYSIRSKG